MTTVADDDIIIAGFVSGYNFENKQIQGAVEANSIRYTSGIVAYKNLIVALE